MRTRRNFTRQGGGVGLTTARRPRPTVSYVLSDEFRTADAAPLASPRTCEPGPGQLVATQADGAFAIVEGDLQLAAQTTPSTGDLALRASTAAARSGERPLIVDLRVDEGEAQAGFWSGTSLANGAAHVLKTAQIEPYAALHYASATAGLLWWIEYGERIRLLIQPRAAGGAFYYVTSPGAFSKWMLAGFDLAGTAANLYAGLASDTATGVVHRLAIADESYAPTAAVQQSSPATGADIAAPAQCVADVKITLGNTLTNGDKAELRLRHLNASNYWSLHFEVIGGAVQLGLEEVTEGTATLRAAETLPLSGGDSAYVQVSAYNAGSFIVRWRPSGGSSEFHTGPYYGDDTLRANDETAVVRLAKTGAPTLSELTVYAAVNEEIPRAI